MKVRDLIEFLQRMDPELDVYLYAGFDGMQGSGPATAVGILEDSVAICDESQADILISD